jgi:co-chaperonin GroES (HSP10)
MEGGVAEPRLKVGQRVLVGRYGGVEIPSEYGERIKVAREDEVLLILPEGA